MTTCQVVLSGSLLDAGVKKLVTAFSNNEGGSIIPQQENLRCTYWLWWTRISVFSKAVEKRTCSYWILGHGVLPLLSYTHEVEGYPGHRTIVLFASLVFTFVL